MSHLHHYFVACSLLLHLSAQATILTVDNNPTNNAQFSALATAITAASAGDTILIQPSTTSYTMATTLTKRLTIIGRGHDPANAFQTIVSGTISINAGAEATVIEGVMFNNNNNWNITVNASEVIIRNCRFFSAITINGSNVIFQGNVITASNSLNLVLNIGSSANSTLVLNNYFSLSNTSTIINGGNATTVMSNNIFVHASTSTHSSVNMFNTNTQYIFLKDNVFITNNVGQFNPSTCSSCNFQNNLSYSAAGTLAFMPGNNLNNTQPTWNFTALPTFAYNRHFNMLSGDPATGATDGGQVGVFGAGYVFDRHGHPRNFPRIVQTAVITPFVPQGGQVQVSFNAVQGQP